MWCRKATDRPEPHATSQAVKVLPLGHEQVPQSPENTHVSATGGAESGALGIDSSSFDPDLRLVIEVWESLPKPTKIGILAMVRAHTD